jgi:plastocyanin
MIGAGETPRALSIGVWPGSAGRRGRRILALVGAGALLAALALPWFPGTGIAEAQARPATWDVQAGGGDEASGISLNAFFPDPLAIHVGDTIRWTTVGPHTITFNSSKPPLRAKRPLGEFLPGPGPGELTVGPAIFPTGAPDTATYGGTEQISSGAPQGPPPSGGLPTFSVTFTAPGIFGYVCEIHPGMRGTIRVEPASDPLEETPAQARTRAQATMGELVTKLRNDMAAYQPASATPVHSALAGVGDGFGGSLLGFLPGNLMVQRGDFVA